MNFALHFCCSSGLTFFKVFEQYLSSCAFFILSRTVTFEANELLALPEEIMEHFRCTVFIYRLAANQFLA